MESRPHILFEKFEILSCIKKDENASVFEAHHRYLDKKIILKTLEIDERTDPVVLQRFQREAKILAQLDHPNVIKVLDFGTQDSCFYISFEYFPSKTLRQLIQHNSLDEEDKVQVFYQLALALQKAHQKGIIHRDIKPENILVDENMRVKLADFGLAQLYDERALTQKSTVVGTPGYMSPEQILGEKLTCQSDLFSLGVVIYEFFTGQNPFLGRDVGATLNNILSTPEEKFITASMPLPPAVKDIVATLLQRNKSKRFASIDVLIDKIQQHYPTLTSIQNSLFAGQKKNNIPLILASSAGIVIIVLVGFIFNYFSGTTEDPVMVTAQNQSQILAEEFNENQTEQPQPVAKSVDKHDGADQITKTKLQESSTTPGKLIVKCLPWVDVYIDSQKVDTTPMQNSVLIFPGEHEIVLKRPDYPTYRKKIHIYSMQLTELAVSLDTLYAFLDCQIYPWAEVFVDNRSYGTTPFAKPLILEPGRHAVKIVNPQYQEIVEYLDLAKKDTTRLDLNLEMLISNRNKEN